jgi:phospholipase/carboxylesterase
MLPPESGQAKQAMVLLHGYGANGQDLLGLGFEWRDTFPDMAFLAPDAPRPCGRNPAGFEWFPLLEDRIAGRIEGAEEAAPAIRELLSDLWSQSGLTPADTVLCGFSQGAMMALHVGLAMPEPLGAVVGFSGALIPPAGLTEERFPKPPVALIHGEFDAVVDPQMSAEAFAELTRLGYDVQLHVSAGIGHGISPDGIGFATEFLSRRLAPTG